MRWAVRWGVRAVLIFALALVGGTVIPRPLWPGAATHGEAAAQRILVLSNPIHTDIAIPITEETRAKFAFLETAGLPVDHPDARWFVFGWGGRAFYLETPTWADLKPLPVLKALTIDRSVLRVEVAGAIAEPNAAVSGFEVTPQNLERLTDFILASFKSDAGETVAISGFSYGPFDRFFEANGAFNVLIGCNTWTARALREAGLRTGWWNPIPATLALSLDWYN